MNIYVGNISYDMTEEQLKKAFADFGEVTSAKIITDKFTGRSKGFGFVEMSDRVAAEEAIKNLNDKELEGRKIRVNESRPRADRPERSVKY